MGTSGLLDRGRVARKPVGMGMDSWSPGGGPRASIRGREVRMLKSGISVLNADGAPSPCQAHRASHPSPPTLRGTLRPGAHQPQGAGGKLVYCRASWLLSPQAGPQPKAPHQRRGLQAVQGAGVKVTDEEATLTLDRDVEDRVQQEHGERAG